MLYNNLAYLGIEKRGGEVRPYHSESLTYLIFPSHDMALGYLKSIWLAILLLLLRPDLAKQPYFFFFFFFFLFYMRHLRPLFNLFSFFQTHYKFYKKCVFEKCPFRILCRNSNSQPLEHGSPPINTRPGRLPANNSILNTRAMNKGKDSLIKGQVIWWKSRIQKFGISKILIWNKWLLWIEKGKTVFDAQWRSLWASLSLSDACTYLVATPNVTSVDFAPSNRILKTI